MKTKTAIVSRITWGFACVVPLISSCGSAQAPAGAAPAPVASAAPSPAMPTAAPVASPAPAAPGAPGAPTASMPAWKNMKTDERKHYMKTVVLPKMKDQFAAFDAKRYGEMNCMTCHGDGAKDGSFAMPNPKLPKLPADEAGFKTLMAKKPDATKFMGGKVVPEMAKMLGESPFNPQTHEGFGCFECHTK
jgi:hypothetical protein